MIDASGGKYSGFALSGASALIACGCMTFTLCGQTKEFDVASIRPDPSLPLMKVGPGFKHPAPASVNPGNWMPNLSTRDIVEFGPPDLFAAIQQQLGLKLQPSTAMLTVVVVDQMDRMPTEN